MKAKSASNKPKRKAAGEPKVRSSALLAASSEERILQLSNDLSEGIKSGSVKEWRTVAKYFRDQLDRAHNDINAIRPSVAAMVMGQNCVRFAHEEMDAWLKRVSS